jgi:hypothetical protein
MPRGRQRKEGKAMASADALYGLPLDQFVSERDELARRLRAAGQREEAARVAKLPKPAVAAWGANQALRSRPAAARELRAAGAALAKTQRGALRGDGKTGGVREAIERHRTALERLVEAARGLLDSKGRSLSPVTVERVTRTLAAASLDPSLRQEAEEARLEREHFYIGLDELAPAGEVKAARRKRPSSPSSSTRNPGREAAVRERRERERELRTQRTAQIRAARQRLSEARKRTATATKARDAAARVAKKATEEHDRAEQRHATALEEQASARSDLDALLSDDASLRSS